MIAQRLPNAGAAAEACARRVTGLLETALEGGEIASFAVSGGSTPRLLFEKLVTLRFDWSRVHLFWVDERCVPPSDPASNYRLAKDWLIQGARIPERNVHRIAGRSRQKKPPILTQSRSAGFSVGSRTRCRVSTWCSVEWVRLLIRPACSRESRSSTIARALRRPCSRHNPASGGSPCCRGRCSQHAMWFTWGGSRQGRSRAGRVSSALEPKKYPSQLIDRGAEWFLDRAATALM